MPNGAKGDHPITDITLHGLTVFGPEIDGLIAELARQGRQDEVYEEVDLTTPREPIDLLEQIQAIAGRSHPSVWVKFQWEPSRTPERMAQPGWSYTSCVQLTDPAEGISGTWAMRFDVVSGAFQDGWLRAVARFLSDRAPWDALLPGNSLWMVFARRPLAKVVVEPGPWYKRTAW